MKEFEQWLNSNRHLLCEDAQALFDDSIKCYKNDIYRAAYLLAYQGVMRHLQEIILQSDEPPRGFTNIAWEDKKKKLRNLDKWDEEVLEAIKLRPKQDGSRDGILTIDEEIRIAFDTQWRILRNECAHHKGRTFIDAHVLVFYAFIKDNLLTISVEGGMRSLLKKFSIFLNPAQTPASESVRPLMENIKTMVRPQEFKDFITGIKDLTIQYHRQPFLLDFLEGAFLYCENSFKEFLLTYLNEDEHKGLRKRYIERHPDEVLRLLTDKTVIREFWYSELCCFTCPLPVLSYMLKAGLIQEVDKEEAFGIIQENMYQRNQGIYELENSYQDILIRSGYFDYFLDTYFTRAYTERKYREMCYKTDFYISHLHYTPINAKFATHLISIFQILPYPYTLQNRIKEELRDNADFRQKLTTICTEENLTLPNSILPQ